MLACLSHLLDEEITSVMMSRITVELLIQKDELPPISCFYGWLKDQYISNEDCEHAHLVWDAFKMKIWANITTCTLLQICYYSLVCLRIVDACVN